LIRSWNVFHGRADPPDRREYLEEAIRLATADRPDVLCLQEVPVWGLSRLGPVCGMTAVGVVAEPPGLGPVPIGAELSRRLSSFHHGLLRSLLTGQANTILLAPSISVTESRSLVLNDRAFRRAQARQHGLGTATRLAWGRHRRICQAVRIRLPDRRHAVVGNLHATHLRDERLADAELLRAAAWACEVAEPGDVLVLAGDFNVTSAGSRALRELTGPAWGFSEPGPGIDHVLARGAQAGPLTVWPESRRRRQGRLLSDHAPVELVIQ
jgi:endonuclease/exonuclease/phosphatase family metal-dependent hydrolase